MDHKLPEPAAAAGRRAMTERILKTPVEVECYIDQVRSLGDANRSALGFLPASAYTETAMKGCLWVAVDQTNKALLGYLLSGGTYPHLKAVRWNISSSQSIPGPCTSRVPLSRLGAKIAQGTEEIWRRKQLPNDFRPRGYGIGSEQVLARHWLQNHTPSGR